jgi:transmembrane sensor
MKPNPAPFNPADDSASDAIVQAAAEWQTRLDAGLTPAERAKFERWLHADPRHAEFFEQMNRTWDLLSRASEVPEAAFRLPPLATFEPKTRRSVPIGFFWTVGLAAAAAVVLGWTVRMHPYPRSSDHPTSFQSTVTAQAAAGEIKRLDLPDGSVIRMNSDTQVVVEYTEAMRGVRLLQGEAFFEVAKNKSRPFIVIADGASVQAVGTAFNVMLKASQVEVLVSEGKVTVSSPADKNSSAAQPAPLLQAGEKLVLGRRSERDPQVTKVASDEIGRALDWRDRRITFDAASLAEIFAEFNRFNVHQLVIAPESAELGLQRFGGSFRADDPQTFVELLKTRAHVIAETDSQRTILRLAP